MKIALAQLNYHIGNFEGNFAKIEKSITEAKREKADLVIFSELAICGYPPRDFLEFDDFIRRCDATVQKVAELTHNIAVIIGAPSKNPQVDGKKLFNSAFFLSEGKVNDVIHKALLPTYDIFDEYRYFEPAKEFHTIEYKGKRIALTICEDLWNAGNENPLYTSCPMDELIKEEPDFIVNVSASPFDYRQAEARISVLKANTERYHLPIFYVNHVGVQTEVIFEGGSLVLNGNGAVYDEMPYFEERVDYYDLNAVVQSAKTDSEDKVQLKDKISLIHDALVLGVQDYFKKLGFKKAILGLSGGIDSAVVLTLAVRALGAKNVMAVLMPSQFSTDHSVSDSKELAKNLNVPNCTIPIKAVYDSFLNELNPHFEEKPFDLAEENIQARIRGVYLMALSNKHGYILLNTSNKSEAAVGYGTLYGDMCGGLSVIGDVYKTETYELAGFINLNGEVIPQNIIDKPPSAELRPNQKDSDSLPDYEILDSILFQYIEKRKGPREIIAMGFDEALVRKTLRLVNMNEYKRYQTPPMLRVSTKAFGMGRRMPIVGKYLG
jgi:NAD+ synthase (glutamine-hydrolysing)